MKKYQSFLYLKIFIIRRWNFLYIWIRNGKLSQLNGKFAFISSNRECLDPLTAAQPRAAFHKTFADGFRRTVSWTQADHYSRVVCPWSLLLLALVIRYRDPGQTIRYHCTSERSPGNNLIRCIYLVVYFLRTWTQSVHCQSSWPQRHFLNVALFIYITYRWMCARLNFVFHSPFWPVVEVHIQVWSTKNYKRWHENSIGDCKTEI